MLNIGIIGLGSMGMTHLAAWLDLADVKVAAVADQKFATPGATIGRVGNIPGQSAATDSRFDSIPKHADADALLADPAIQAVDICAPTVAHKALALAAIRAGKHVLIEKPLARHSADAREIVAAARKAGVVLMPAHCMRFWPGWDWLKEAVATGRYGAVESAQFTRVGARPETPFYYDGEACGGAHFDFHIHDVDFVLHVFGMPTAVSSIGRIGKSGAVEHTFTRYHFAGAASSALVTTEGAWTRDAEKRPFIMRYVVVFERATAVFEIGANPALTLFQAGCEPAAVVLPPGLGYEREVAEFARCAAAGTDSGIVRAEDGFRTLEILEAELCSIQSGQTVRL